jgi:hypothetical protein
MYFSYDVNGPTLIGGGSPFSNASGSERQSNQLLTKVRVAHIEDEHVALRGGLYRGRVPARAPPGDPRQRPDSN